MTGPSGQVAPEDESVLRRIGVITRARGGDGESHRLVEAPCPLVRGPDLEGGPDRAKTTRLGQYAPHQQGAQPLSAVRRAYREVVDVRLVHDEPERAESRHP